MKKKELKLRNVIREIVLAELHKQSQRLFLCSSENAKEISRIVDREARNAKTISKMLTKLETQIHCGVKIGHCLTIQYVYADACVFRCMKCELEYTKSKERLTHQESALLKTVSEGD